MIGPISLPGNRCGRLEIEPYPAAAIVPTNEALTALQGNVLQAIHVWPDFASGRNPAFAALCDLIFAYEQPWKLDAFRHYRGGLELLRDLYKPFGAYTVGAVAWGVESWPSKRPIRNMDDFKGLKIREPQGMESEFMAKAGASTVVLPGTEVFSALDKGVVDATNWATASINNQTGFNQVAPYFTYPGFHSMPVGDFTVRQANWDKLPEDIKQILTTACREWAWDTIQKVAMDDAKADQARHRTAGSLAAGARTRPVIPKQRRWLRSEPVRGALPSLPPRKRP